MAKSARAHRSSPCCLTPWQSWCASAGGAALLLDARRARGLMTDSAQLEGVCKNLRNAGFARLIDFTAEHMGAGQGSPCCSRCAIRDTAIAR